VPAGFSAEFREVDLTTDWGVSTPPKNGGVARSNATSLASPARAGEQSQVTNEHEIATPPTAARNDMFDIVFSFATLHHIPSREIRLSVLKTVHGLLVEGGRFIHSNWQFLNSPRLRQRVRGWSEAGLTEADVDADDYLLDWRSGGTGLRYVHHFSEAELAALAESSGFTIFETFYSDGKEGNLAIYQVWQKR
jgi:hypothetical protein